MAENERFEGKRIEKGGWTTKYKDRHLESQGDGEHPFSAPQMGSAESESENQKRFLK